MERRDEREHRLSGDRFKNRWKKWISILLVSTMLTGNIGFSKASVPTVYAAETEQTGTLTSESGQNTSQDLKQQDENAAEASENADASLSVSESADGKDAESAIVTEGDDESEKAGQEEEADEKEDGKDPAESDDEEKDSESDEDKKTEDKNSDVTEGSAPSETQEHASDEEESANAAADTKSEQGQSETADGLTKGSDASTETNALEETTASEETLANLLKKGLDAVTQTLTTLTANGTTEGTNYVPYINDNGESEYITVTVNINYNDKDKASLQSHRPDSGNLANLFTITGGTKATGGTQDITEECNLLDSIATTNGESYQIQIPVYIKEGSDSADLGEDRLTTKSDFYHISLNEDNSAFTDGYYVRDSSSKQVIFKRVQNEAKWKATSEITFNCQPGAFRDVSFTIKWYDDLTDEDRDNYAPEITLYQSDGAEIIAVDALQTEPDIKKSKNTWTYTFKNLKADKDTVYFIKETVPNSTGNKRAYNVNCEADNNCYVIESGKHASLDKYKIVSEAVNIIQSQFHFDINWYDGEDTTHRLSSDDLDGNMYIWPSEAARFTESTAIKGKDYTISLENADNNKDSYIISGSGLPAFDATGKKLSYVARLKTDKILIGAEGDAFSSYYDIAYNNGIKSSNISVLGDGGSIEATLKSQNNFTTTVQWLFDQTDLYAAEKFKKDLTDGIELFLYRYAGKETTKPAAAIDANGKQYSIKINKASPSEITKDGLSGYEMTLTDADFTGTGHSPSLPEFDEKGYPYTYFVKELLPTDSSFHRSYVSKEGEKEDEDESEEKGTESASVSSRPSGAYDGEIIRNVIERKIPFTLEKDWLSKASAKYAGQDVTLQLQSRVKAETSGNQSQTEDEQGWTDVLSPITLSGFSTLCPTREQTLKELVNVYSETGKALEFRAKELKVGNATPVDHYFSIGDRNYRVQQESWSVTENTENTTDSARVRIKNTLEAEQELHITKIWSDTQTTPWPELLPGITLEINKETSSGVSKAYDIKLTPEDADENTGGESSSETGQSDNKSTQNSDQQAKYRIELVDYSGTETEPVLKLDEMSLVSGETVIWKKTESGNWQTSFVVWLPKRTGNSTTWKLPTWIVPEYDVEGAYISYDMTEENLSGSNVYYSSGRQFGTSADQRDSVSCTVENSKSTGGSGKWFELKKDWNVGLKSEYIQPVTLHVVLLRNAATGASGASDQGTATASANTYPIVKDLAAYESNGSKPFEIVLEDSNNWSCKKWISYEEIFNAILTGGDSDSGLSDKDREAFKNAEKSGEIPSGFALAVIESNVGDQHNDTLDHQQWAAETEIASKVDGNGAALLPGYHSEIRGKDDGLFTPSEDDGVSELYAQITNSFSSTVKVNVRTIWRDDKEDRSEDQFKLELFQNVDGKSQSIGTVVFYWKDRSLIDLQSVKAQVLTENAEGTKESDNQNTAAIQFEIPDADPRATYTVKEYVPGVHDYIEIPTHKTNAVNGFYMREDQESTVVSTISGSHFTEIHNLTLQNTMTGGMLHYLVPVIWNDAATKNIRPDVSFNIYRKIFDAANNTYKYELLEDSQYDWKLQDSQEKAGTNPKYYQKMELSIDGLPKYNAQGKVCEYACTATLVNKRKEYQDPEYYSSYDLSGKAADVAETDGYLDLNGQPTIAIVNNINDYIKIYGMKQWVNMDNSQDQKPEARIKLYRATMSEIPKDETQGSSDVSGTYLGYTTLADDRESYRFDRSAKTHMDGMEEDVSDASTGLLSFSKYDSRGYRYNYKLKEQILMDDQTEMKDYVMSSGIADFNLTNTYHVGTTNARKITVTKSWDNVTFPENFTTVPRARFVLYRGEYNENDIKTDGFPELTKADGTDGEEQMPEICADADTAREKGGVYQVAEKIISYKLKKDDGTNNPKGTDTITSWGEGTDDSLLPMYASNGKQYVYFVCEDLSFAPSYTPSTSGDGFKALKIFSDGNKTYQPYIISNVGIDGSVDMSKEGTSDAQQKNIKEIRLTNTYKNDSTILSITGTKNWNDAGQKELRPEIETDGKVSDMILTLTRTARAQSGVDNPFADTATSSTPSVYSSYQYKPEEITVRWTKPDPDNDRWTFTIEPVSGVSFPRYAPNGQPFTYRVTESYSEDTQEKPNRTERNYRITRGSVEKSALTLQDNGTLSLDSDLENTIDGTIRIEKNWLDSINVYKVRENSVLVQLFRKASVANDSSASTTVDASTGSDWELVTDTETDNDKNSATYGTKAISSTQDIGRHAKYSTDYQQLPSHNKNGVPYSYVALEVAIEKNGSKGQYDWVSYNGNNIKATSTEISEKTKQLLDNILANNTETKDSKCHLGNYEITQSGFVQVVNADTKIVTIKNQLTSDKTLTVVKKWESDQGEKSLKLEHRPENINLALLYALDTPDNDYTIVNAKNAVISGDQSKGWFWLKGSGADTSYSTLSLSDQDRDPGSNDVNTIWKRTFKNLPNSIIVNGEAKTVKYAVIEIDDLGSSELENGFNITDKTQLVNSYTVSYDGFGMNYVTITNHYERHAQITVKKELPPGRTGKFFADIYASNFEKGESAKLATDAKPVATEELKVSTGGTIASVTVDYLPKYNQDQKPIHYFVKERLAEDPEYYPEYNVKVSGSDSSETEKTENTKIAGTDVYCEIPEVNSEILIVNKQVQLTIQKQAGEAILPGGVFKLTDETRGAKYHFYTDTLTESGERSGSTEASMQFTTGKDGKISLAGALIPGHQYQMEEITAPAGYARMTGNLAYITVAKDGNIQVTGRRNKMIHFTSGSREDTSEDTKISPDQDPTITVENKLTRFTVEKTDAEEKLLPGSEITLSKKGKGDSEFLSVSEDLFHWDEQEPAITVSGLEEGVIYRLREEKRPAGYYAAEDLYFKLVGVDAGEYEARDSGIVFCDKDGNSINTERADAKLFNRETTQQNALLTTEGIRILNRQIMIPVSLRKLRSGDSTPIAGVEIEIYRKGQTASPSEMHQTSVVYGITDKDGLLRPKTASGSADSNAWIQLPEGEYLFHEIAVPDDVYFEDKLMEFSIRPEDFGSYLGNKKFIRNMLDNTEHDTARMTLEDQIGELENQRFLARVQLKKFDSGRYEYNGATENWQKTPLAGAEFTLQKKKGENWISVSGTDTAEYVSDDKGYVHKMGDDLNYVEITEKGQYRFIETKNQGYQLSNTAEAVPPETLIREFEIGNEDFASGGVSGDKMKALGEMDNLRLTGTISLEKHSSDKPNKALNDTHFVLFRDQSDTKNFFVDFKDSILEFLTGKSYRYETWAELIVKKQNPADLEQVELKLMDKDTRLAEPTASVNDGILKIEKLPWGKYVLMETEAATGYHLKTGETANEYRFEIDRENAGTIVTLAQPVVNGINHITFTKMGYSVASSSEISSGNASVKPLTGGKFRILDENDKVVPFYRTSSADAEMAETFQIDNPDGSFEIFGLPGGTGRNNMKLYHIREIEAPKDYLKTDDIWFGVDTYGRISDLPENEHLRQHGYVVNGNNNTIVMYDDSERYVDVHVQKKFAENFSEDSMKKAFEESVRPRSIEVQLYKKHEGDAQSVPVGDPVMLRSEDGWKDPGPSQWQHLPRYDIIKEADGNYTALKNIYTLSENGLIPNYLYDNDQGIYYSTELSRDESQAGVLNLTLTNTLKTTFTNSGKLRIEKLNVSGPQKELFNMEVELYAMIPTEDKPNGVETKLGDYHGPYVVKDRNSGEELKTVNTEDSDGYICLAGGQAAEIDLPTGIYYRVKEILRARSLDSDTYKTEYQTTYRKNGAEVVQTEEGEVTKETITENEEIKNDARSYNYPNGVIISKDAYVMPTGRTDQSFKGDIITVENRAVVFTKIDNTTPELEDMSGAVVTRGGLVSVLVPKDAEKPSGEGIEMDTDSATDWEANSLLVSWKPEKNWDNSDSFRILYRNYSADSSRIETIDVADYLDQDGNPKEKTDACYDALRARYPDFEIWKDQGDEIRLKLSAQTDGLPYSSEAKVRFVPTLAVENTTEGDVGGLVRVENGTDNPGSDGVPEKDRHRRYKQTVVYGTAEDGYVIDLDHLAIGQAGQLSGSVSENHSAVKLKLKKQTEDQYTFDAVLKIGAGTQKSGKTMLHMNSFYHMLKARPLAMQLAITPSASTEPDGIHVSGTVYVLSRTKRQEVSSVKIHINEAEGGYLAMPIDVGIPFKKQAAVNSDTHTSGGSSGGGSSRGIVGGLRSVPFINQMIGGSDSTTGPGMEISPEQAASETAESAISGTEAKEQDIQNEQKGESNQEGSARKKKLSRDKILTGDPSAIWRYFFLMLGSAAALLAYCLQKRKKK